MRFRASEVAAAVGGTLVGQDDVEVHGAGIDSRTLSPGQLFVPVSGSRDGHDFVGDALARGAAAYLTARPPTGGTAVVVADPVAALGMLGVEARRRLRAQVVGITGSVGKTSTKDLVAGALARSHRTHASERSFNNELGVPLTLLNAPEDTEVAVLEMGARGPGHVADLCALARPDVGVVTSVEMVHTEMFGDLDGVAAAKCELVQMLPATGVAVLNADDPRVRRMADRTDARVLLFGVGDGDGGRDVRAVDVELDAWLRPTFELVTPWGATEVRLAVRGRHQVGNALAAAAVALALGADMAGVAAGLGEASLSPSRMHLARAAGGATVLDDSYNAGPASVEAALRSLVHLRSDRHIAVLGPMAELGEHGPAEHRRIAALASSLGVQVLAVGAPDYGDAVLHLENVEDVVEALGDLGERDAVLVKGSRVAGLERVAQALLER